MQCNPNTLASYTVKQACVFNKGIEKVISLQRLFTTDRLHDGLRQLWGSLLLQEPINGC